MKLPPKTLRLRAIGYYLAAGCGAAADFLLFLLLIRLGFSMSVAAASSTALGALTSYLLNVKFVFKVETSFVSFARFASIGVASTVLAGAGVPFISEMVKSAVVGKLCWMALQAAAQFVLHTTWTFRPRN